MLKNNKKAGVGEAITWVVATIIIFVILSIFIFASSALGKFKTFNLAGEEVELDLDSKIKVKTQIALKKSNNANEAIIKNWIGEAKKFG